MSITIAVLGIFGSLVLFYLTKKSERERQWQQNKLDQYKNLLLIISKLSFNESDQEIVNSINKEWNIAFNTISLSASQSVIAALIEFNETLIPTLTKELTKEQRNKKQNEFFKKLILEIRKDIGLSKADNEETFKVCLLTLPPGKYDKKTS